MSRTIVGERMSFLIAALVFGAAPDAPAVQSEPDEPVAPLTQPSGPGLWIGGFSFGREDIVSAVQSWDPYGGAPNILLTLSESGQEKFARAQDGRVGQRLEISVDGVLVSSPSLLEPIVGVQVQISGAFSVEEAEAIARRLIPAGSP